MKWLERKFEFEKQHHHYPTLMQRLESTPGNLAGLLSGAMANQLIEKPGGKWSVHEHLGHLLMMESLWIARLDDLVMGHPTMRPWSGNDEVELMQFNRQRANRLLEDFEHTRHGMVRLMRTLEPKAAELTCFHERLGVDMSLADHAWFIAEHDEHHLEAIRGLIKCMPSDMRN